mmetsp:Transcript_10001/g.28025  ORF Transcript_10001/g.28025 Transcript_10001/m.28025 type:complete len:101 (+) Transcript_10001:245-547(+)
MTARNQRSINLLQFEHFVCTYLPLQNASVINCAAALGEMSAMNPLMKQNVTRLFISTPAGPLFDKKLEIDLTHQCSSWEALKLFQFFEPCIVFKNSTAKA